MQVEVSIAIEVELYQNQENQRSSHRVRRKSLSTFMH